MLTDGETTVEMAFDATGNLSNLTNHGVGSRGSVRYDYNSHNNVITASSTYTFLTLTYDDNGNLLGRLTKNGSSVISVGVRIAGNAVSV